MEKETLEEAAGDNKKIEDYYLGKTLKLKKDISSKHYEIFLKKSETIKIDKFVDGDVEGCRVAVGYKYGYEFLLFNTTHAESYLRVCFELIDESTITQEESKQETQGYICPQTKIQCDDECCVSAEECHIEQSIGVISDCEPKQETLEEAAYRLASEKFEPKHIGFMLGVIEGAKWQAERMYSEEEVRGLIIKALTHNDYDLCGSLATRDCEIRTANFEVWFEHNKK